MNKNSVDVLSMDKVKRNIIKQIQETLATIDSSNLNNYRGFYVDPANDRTVEYKVYLERKFKVNIDGTRNDILYEVPVHIKSSDGIERDIFIETFENEAFLEERRKWFEWEMLKIKE